MSELSLLELDAQFSELLPEREALGVVSGNLSLSHFNPCHDHHHHHHCEPPKQQHHCEPPKHDPCPPAKHDPCPPPHKPCDDDFGKYGHGHGHGHGGYDDQTPPKVTPPKFTPPPTRTGKA